MRTVRVAVVVVVALLAACTHPAGGLDIPDFHASAVSNVRIRFEVFPDWPPPHGHRCCRVVTFNPAQRTLFGTPCQLTARDAAGHVLFAGPISDPGPAGLGAPPGRHLMGYVSIEIEHARRIASSTGSCRAWDWGSNGPPP